MGCVVNAKESKSMDMPYYHIGLGMASIMDVEMRSSIKKEARCTDWVTGRENRFVILLTDRKGLDFAHDLAVPLLTEV